MPAVPATSFVLVATLVVRRAKLAEFHAFEQRAAAIMRRYGGEILEALFVDTDPSSESVRELHVISFPDRPAFDTYRVDPELLSLGALRERAIASTTVRIWPG
ncbi:MAG TPA: hypothetical protein VGK73_26620 [Polyangiaceae bacterium]